jgi:RHS repeat-associated protein
MFSLKFRLSAILLTILVFLITSAIPPPALAISSRENSANTWAVPDLSLDYFSSPAEAAAFWVSENGGNIVFTGPVSGPITVEEFNIPCSVVHPCYQVALSQINPPTQVYVIAQYVDSAPIGTIYADGSYAPLGQVFPGKSLGCNCPDGSAQVGVPADNGTGQVGGPIPGGVQAGDPIDVGSGNMSEQATDYQTAGQNPLRFVRYYNSLSSFTTPASMLGSFWRTNYDRYIRILSPQTVFAERYDGRELTFTLNGTAWVTDSDVDVTLTNSGSVWTLTDHDDTVETYITNSIGSVAVLQTITSRNGYTQTLSYNSSGQLSQVTDSYNRILALSYSNGLLQAITTPDETTINYGFGATTEGNELTTVTYPTSPESTLTYVYKDVDLPFALTGIIDEKSNQFASWSYDAFGRALSSQQGNGVDLTTVIYDDTTGNRTVTNAFGATYLYKFSVLQSMPKVTEIDRQAINGIPAAMRLFAYDANGYTASATDWNGNQTGYINDAHGQPTTITEPTRTTTISYDPIFVHLPHQIITTGLTTIFAYDSSGNVQARTDTDATTQTIPYKTNGQTRTWAYTWNNFLLASVQNPRTDKQLITRFGYDGDAALISITDALNHITSIPSHTAGGLPLTIVNPNNVSTALTYDGRQRLTSSTVTTGMGALTTTYTLDPVGELAKLTLPDNSFFSYDYDSAHRLVEIADTQNENIQYTLDALSDITAGNTFDSNEVLRYQHSATFDALGRILTDVGGAGQTTAYSNYDNNGNVQTITDPLMHATTQSFDALNRLTKFTDANMGLTQFMYDTHDRITQVTDANNDPTRYAYDGFGDTIGQASPDSANTVYYYDGDRNLTKKIDALKVTANFTYDQLDRVTSRSYLAEKSQNVAYVYDQRGMNYFFGVGHLTTMTDDAGTLTLGYDERGNLDNALRAKGTATQNVFYTYDLASRIASIEYPSRMTVAYQRDSDGNVSSVTALPPGGGTPQTVATTAFAPFGPLTALAYGDNETSARQFDLDYRMQSVTDANSTGVNLMAFNYVYDMANNLKMVTDLVNPSNDQSLGYDVINRLTGATGNYGNYAWQYDKVGNLTTLIANSVATMYGYTPGSNRLATITSGNTINVLTNANGNITKIPPANSGVSATFAYNAANRLASVSGSPLGATFAYDGFGRRITKTDPGTRPIVYAYDQQGTLLEENNSGTVTDYIYVNGMPLAVLASSGKKSALYYAHTDRLTTPQLATTNTQTAAWSTTYQPYGTTGLINGSITQNLRFPGQYADVETHFYYNLNRDYMPNLGRYLESDSIGLVAGPNPYLYANANPPKFVDPSGLEPNLNYGGSWQGRFLNVPNAYTVLGEIYKDPQGNLAIGGADSPDALAYNIWTDRHYVYGEPVIIYACTAGIDGFAQQVASALNKLNAQYNLPTSNVYGPNGFVSPILTGWRVIPPNWYLGGVGAFFPLPWPDAGWSHYK